MRNETRRLVLPAMFALAIAGCAHEHHHEGTTPQGMACACGCGCAAEQACACPMHGHGHAHGEGMHEGRAGCPMGHGHGAGPMAAMMAQGAQVQEEDIDGGAAIVFTTPNEEQVEALRAHVQQMSSMPGWTGQRPPMALPPSTATVVDVPGGARLELRAQSPADVEALRESARMRAEHVRSGCPMMRHAATQPPGPPS